MGRNIERIGVGTYVDRDTNQLEFDILELIAHFGYADTPENRDKVTAIAIKAARQVFPAIKDQVVTTSDPAATHRSLQEHGISGVKIRRNSLCPCGSGRKYKHCCLRYN